VSLTSLIPGLRGTGGRRAVDKVDELRDENRRLLTRQMVADDYFALLLQDRADVYEAWEFERQKRTEAEQAAAAMQSERDDWRDRFLALQARFGPQLAAEANATAVTVPPMVRDTTAIEDQATGPIYVQPLWDAADAGLLGPVADPAGVHAEGVA